MSPRPESRVFGALRDRDRPADSDLEEVRWAPEAALQREPEPRGTARVLPFPFARLIRDCIEREQVPAARDLVRIAMQQDDPGPAVLRWQRLLAPPRVRVSDKKDVDRTADFQWLDAHASSYRGQWVLVAGGGLVGHSPSLKEALASATERSGGLSPLAVFIEPESDAEARR